MMKSFDYSRRAGKFVWQIQLGCEYFDIIENIKDESLPKKERIAESAVQNPQNRLQRFG